MAQVGWVYLDDFGKQHRVGLYHGDQSGHLVIHCNRRVIQIDFLVKETRTYSFFIEDELCEIMLFREPDSRFSYDFHVNKTIDTPRNRLRRSDERRNRRQLLVFVAGLLVLLAAVVVGLRWYDGYQRQAYRVRSSLTSRLDPAAEQRLSAEGRTAIAQLVVIRESLQRRVFYSFTTRENLQITGRFSVPDTGQILLPNGFPLADHDAFETTYQPSDPKVHRVDFFRPAPATVEAYLRRAAEAQHRAHPDESRRQGLCLAQLALQRGGWKQLAHIIFQSTSPEQNAAHNRDSYHRLVRDVEFNKALKEKCWDQ
jgi:hypothetical protein